jgi:transposase InsO family protein
MSFDPVVIAQARQEIKFAPHGHKSVMAGKWAAVFGISYQSMYRLIQDTTKKRERKGDPVKAEYRDWTKIVFQIKKRPPEEAGEISTEDAIVIGIKSGELPAEAAMVPVGTYNLIARKAGYTKQEIRANRFQAERPNQAHHFDASTSKFFYIAKSLGNGDYLLKIHRPAKHYKNKPIPVDKLRPWIYGLTDDHSGRFIARYVAAQGENSADSMSFLSWAWSDIGLPEKLLADQGMLKKALPSRDLIERLGVELPEMMPYQKRGHGKIERPWRTAWQKFELPFFGVSDWDKFEISMTEMNQQLTNYINDKYNQLPHRFENDITRLQAWNRINLHGGIITIPENALATVLKRSKRKVDIAGILQYEGASYEVKGLHEAWVYVFEGVFDDRLIVQEIATGKKYEVRKFAPLALDEYRAHPETAHQKLIAEDQLQVAHSAMLYATAKPADEKIISMPIRTKEEREIADPFDVHHYATLADAMKEFSEIVGTFIHPEEREGIEAAIVGNGLNKQFVTDLALEVSGALEVERQSAVG